MLQQFLVQEPIAAADPLQQATLGAVVEEGNVIPWGGVAASQDIAQAKVLNEGKPTTEKKAEK